MLVTRKTSSMTRRDHKTHKLYRISNACADRWKQVNTSWTALVGSWTLRHVELDEPPSKDGHRPDDAHGHEHAEQDVVQNHGDEFPLLCRLQENEGFINPP